MADSSCTDDASANEYVGNAVCLPNPHLAQVEEHFLYHLGISTATTDFPVTFKNVKFVCIGGTASRMEEFAHYMAKELGLTESGETDVHQFRTERYVMFKVGPVLAASHGIGVPSLSVLLHELFKLLHLAGCSDVTLLRLGTCGGIGVEEGTVIVSNGALNSRLKPFYKWFCLGKTKKRPLEVDADLANELQACAEEGDGFSTILGTTLCTDDFYEAQARLDGALCDFTPEDKQQFMEKLHDMGVRNIEMESAGVFSLCHAVGIKAAVACVCIVNRKERDVPRDDGNVLEEYEKRPQVLASRFIRHRLANASRTQ